MSENKSPSQRPLIFIVGPTATGKSDYGLTFAEKYQGSIVNIDSVQTYKGLEIGSAAPTKEDQIRVPHYLYSYVEAPQELTAGQYVRDFYQLIETKNIKGPLFVVGGTGFYIQALLQGMFNLPEVDPELKNQIEAEIDFENIRLTEMGLPSTESVLYKELKSFDPESVVHANDFYRIGRALEVKRAFKLKMSDLQKQQTKNQWPFEVLKLGLLPYVNLEKSDFQKRVQLRAQKMIQSGILEETEFYYKQHGLNWAPLRSVGYFECVQYLNQEIELADLNEKISQSTLKLVKKQLTWFKRDTQIQWQVWNQVQIADWDNKICQYLEKMI